MKRVLLSFALLFFAFLGRSQAVLNEVYTTPGSGRSEYFELYNTSTSVTPVNVGSYTLVTYFENATEKGFFVLDFPNDVSIGPKGYLIGASSGKAFNYQGSTANADFWWTDPSLTSRGGSITKWVLGTTDNLDGNLSYDKATISSTDYNDVFRQNGSVSVYHVLLYQNGILVNAFFSAYSGSTIPNGDNSSNIRAMPNLFISMDGGSPFTINFKDLNNNGNTANAVSTDDEPEKGEFVIPADGTDNGFIREFDGKCGSWRKASSKSNHTPGVTNGSAADLVGQLDFVNPNGGTYNCGSSPRSITFDIVSGPAEAFAARVEVWQDANGDGQLSSGDLYVDVKNFESAASGPYTVNLPLNNQAAILVAITPQGCFDRVFVVDNSCITLPVSFRDFTALRNKQNVSLKWETAAEQNNRGFNVQRNTKGVWENIAFVFSAADGGNSNELLSYSFNDANTEKVVSQYRIQQVDLDGKASYSVIRSVKGEGQVSKTLVYPNPSAEGKVNVVFEDQAAKAVTVSDMSGRIIRQYRSVVNNVVVDGLESGMYTIQITDLSSAVSTTEKVIIKKR
jgi:hypothetical protein